MPKSLVLLRFRPVVTIFVVSMHQGLIAAGQLCKISVPDVKPSHKVAPLIMGCHSDSGYAHQARGLHAELLYGSAFESVPDGPRVNGAGGPLKVLGGWLASGGAGLDSPHSPDALAPGATSLLLPAGGAAALNRGFAGEGLYVEGDKDYNGYLLVTSPGPVKIGVKLQRLDGLELSTATLFFAGGPWTRIKFTLMPSIGTDCTGIDYATAQVQGVACPLNNTYKPDASMSDRSAHICVQCGGQFVLTLLEGSNAKIGYASLMPGKWGLFQGLPAKVDAVAALQKMGVTALRQGGSFLTYQPQMAWKNWRGDVWRRPSAVKGNWNHGLISGWGMFEMIDMCNAMGVKPIVTLYCGVPADELADLVEYCWGDASTKMGRLRVADGHAAPYNVTHFEIGNEQADCAWVEQVQAMEKRASSLGMAKTLHYYLSNGWGANFPSTTLAKQAQALGLGDHLVWDIHVNDPSGTTLADQFFKNSSYTGWAAANLETNLGDHTVKRMLDEALDINKFLAYPDGRLKGRTGSFCMERSGYNEGGLNDQGLVFFLPNMTWLQPPGHVHAMVSETWQPLAVNFTASEGCGAMPEGAVSAQASPDGRTVVVRLVNPAAERRAFAVDVAGAGAMTVQYIASADLHGANTPASPSRIAPSARQPLAAGTAWAAPGHSYGVIVAARSDDLLVI